jgi:hypothetical protein
VTDEERDHLAKEVIAQAAIEWENKPDAYVDVVNNTPHFVFVLHTHGAFDDEDCSRADTVVHYNPYIELIEHMKGSEAQLEKREMSERERAKLIKRYASDQLHVMLKLASRHFADSLWQLSIVANTTARCHVSEIMGRYDLRKGLVDSALRLLISRWEDRWRTRRNVKAVHHKISHFSLRSAIQKLGGRPSQRKTAAELGVSEKLLRDFLRAIGVEDEQGWEALLDMLEAEEHEAEERRNQMRRNHAPFPPYGSNEGSENP